MTVGTRIQARRDTAANWTSANPVLSAGECGLESDTHNVKYGDGTTAWNSLAYALSATYAPISGSANYGPLFSASRFPGWSAVPTLMGSTPTLTLGVAEAASSISGSVLVAMDRPATFTYTGGPITRGVSFPDSGSFGSGAFYVNTTQPPWAVEFVLDSSDGLFEIDVKGQGAVRVVVNGQYATLAASFNQTAATHQLDLVNLGAAGTYRIKLEFTGTVRFYGLRCIPGTGVTEVAHKRRKRVLVFGDSFSEPTIVDSGTSYTHDGWTSILSWLTGWDVVVAAKGGTGYMNPGPTVKLASRIAEGLTGPWPGGIDAVLFACGINDQSYGSFSYASELAEVTACIQAVQASGQLNVGAKIFAISPFWRNEGFTMTTNLFLARDAVKAATVATGTTYIETMPTTLPAGSGDAATTLSSGASAGATSIATAGAVSTGQAFLINPGGANQELRKRTSGGSTSPGFTAGGGALSNTHISGEAVVEVDTGALTGTGKQGTTTGDGNSDRYVGSDGTHPTKPGHAHWARNIAAKIAAALPI